MVECKYYSEYDFTLIFSNWPFYKPLSILHTLRKYDFEGDLKYATYKNGYKNAILKVSSEWKPETHY